MNAPFAIRTATQRTYAIEPIIRHDGLRHGLNVRSFRAFRLHLTGDGHWGTMNGVDHTRHFYMTRDVAEQKGRAWVETGRVQ